MLEKIKLKKMRVVINLKVKQKVKYKSDLESLDDAHNGIFQNVQEQKALLSLKGSSGLKKKVKLK